MLLDETLHRLLQTARSIAILGAKDTPTHPVDRVGRYLIAAGYTVFPVHPVRRSVWGISACKTVAELPQPVDIINLFHAPAHCPAHAREVLALPWLPRCFWMQAGIRSPEAGQMLAEKGVTIVEDMCIMTAHSRLLGDLHG